MPVKAKERARGSIGSSVGVVAVFVLEVDVEVEGVVMEGEGEL